MSGQSVFCSRLQLKRAIVVQNAKYFQQLNRSLFLHFMCVSECYAYMRVQLLLSAAGIEGNLD